MRNWQTSFVCLQFPRNPFPHIIPTPRAVYWTRRRGFRRWFRAGADCGQRHTVIPRNQGLILQASRHTLIIILNREFRGAVLELCENRTSAIFFILGGGGRPGQAWHTHCI